MSPDPFAPAQPRVEPIAIIGLKGRFPGAPDVEQLWRNLAAGVESISTHTPAELRAAGIPDHIARLPGYVNASPVLDDVDQFDAAFFGFSARDASLTDPQHRIFLETAWEALEDAGHDPARFDGAIGVFGGCELSSYLYQLHLNASSLGYLDGMQLMVTNDKDHLCTQVAYRLDLHGPAVAVQTTCSTSLTALALACDSLRAGSSDLALAGGVTVRVPQRAGYYYTAGSILSPDGHCRPFDATAQGTVVGSGVGVVALRRLSDALADGDHIRAVILGVGINNDGSAKAGYTAPSSRGQAAAIRAALRMAGVSAESVTYVEAHGTGTILGDPIELSALTEVYREHTTRRGYCAIGSVKSNVGHLSCASGVTGLTKAVLALEHGAVPPTLHYTRPNPAIDFASSPFYVTTRLHPWDTGGRVRRAGVSSFGVGGTNVHVVLEEAPAPADADPPRSHQVLTLSARTPTALDAATERLADHLERHPATDLADAAFTLHLGRRAFPHRRVVATATGDHDGAAAALRASVGEAAPAVRDGRGVVLMFSGQGTQYPGMAAGLYGREPVVRRAVDHCAKVLRPELGTDLRRLLFPAPRRRRAAAETLQDTAFTQPALFTVEWALAELWRSWGVTPTAVIGHSVGEYVAAVVAGVLGLDEALRLVARRGRLMAGLPRGSMLGVMAPSSAVERYVDGDVCLAAVNAPGFTVLAGPTPAIERVRDELDRSSVPARLLRTSHAFHSSMMDPILDEFEALVAGVDLSPPSIPLVANLTGDWADGDLTDPSAWSAQLRSPVRFADGLQTLVAPGSPAGPDPVLLEVGPGRTLVTFAAQGADGWGPLAAVPTLPGADDPRTDVEVAVAAVGRLWAEGVTVEWEGFHATERRRRVPLPSYPFERQRYWVGTTPTTSAAGPAAPRDPATWFRRPTWVEAPLEPPAAGLAGARVLVFDDASGSAASVLGRLLLAGATPVVVRPAAAYERVGDDLVHLDPSRPDDYRRLAAEVTSADRRLAAVVDCWSAGAPATTDLDEAATTALLHPLRLAHALSTFPTARPLPFLLVARGVRAVEPGDVLDPARAFGLGVAKVIPQEHPGTRMAHVDVDADPSVPDLLVAELAAGLPAPAVAFRGGRRLVERFARSPLEAVTPDGLPDDPVVLVTGGLGHMGLALAEALAEQRHARLVLVGRSTLPEPDAWAGLAANEAVEAVVRERMRRLAALRERQPDLLVVAADLDDPAQVIAAVEAAVAHHGRLDLVVHGAANLDPAAFAAAADTTERTVALQLSPKVRGLLYLRDALAAHGEVRVAVHSSISSVLGGLGLAAYAGANAVLDALAESQGWLSILWDAWDNAGEAGASGMPDPIMPDEGGEAFLRSLGAGPGRLLVATGDFDARLAAWSRPGEPVAARQQQHARPSLATPLVEPRSPTEHALAEIWAEQLGVAPVGVLDRFFDLGGHSLLAVQVASQIRDHFHIDLPVAQLFQAPTVAELAPVVERALAGGPAPAPAAASPTDVTPAAAPGPLEEGPGAVSKAHYRAFYDDVTRRLEASGVGSSSFFLNYGYVSLGGPDEALFEPPEGALNPNSIRLAAELVGTCDLRGLRVLDVGCGRGGTAALLAEALGAAGVTGVDLSPEAVAFCRRTHRHPALTFEVGDAEHLPLPDGSVDAVTNLESSHTYPDLRAFLGEVRRVLAPGGWFLHTDLLPVERWVEVRALLEPLGLEVVDDRDITTNVLASCDEVAARRTGAFGGGDALIDNFLAVPGSAVYETMRTGQWAYRVVRSRKR